MTLTTTGVYKYRRRTPLELKQFIPSSEIIRSLGKDMATAANKVMELNAVIDQVILLLKMPSIPSSVCISMLQEHKLTPAEVNTISQNKKSLSHIIGMFIDKADVSKAELSNMMYVYHTLLPAISKALLKEADPEIERFTYDHILKISKLIEKLPNRNYREYRKIDIYDLVMQIHLGKLTVPSAHRMSAVTVHNHVKRVKALMLFAQQLNLYNHALPRTLMKNSSKGSDRDYKAVIPQEELSILYSSMTDDRFAYIYKVLYYTGMRRSELYKCTISIIDGIQCFDLRTAFSLKTKSSYRVIPVHPNLMYMIDEYKDIIASIKPERMTKVFTKFARGYFHDPERKSLYSLRHTFATDLIAKGVQPEIVSELMGHSHATMTMSRYVKGFPISTLKEAIERL